MILALPVSQLCRVRHSSVSRGPAARWMQPSTAGQGAMNRGAPRVTPESVLQKRRRRPKHRILPIPSAVPGLTRHRASSRGLQPLAIAAAPTCSTSGEAKGGGGRRRGAAGRGRARPTLLVPRRAAAARAGQGPPPAGVARFVGVRGGRNRHSRLAKGKVALPALAWTHRGARDLWPPPPEEPGSADRHRASIPRRGPSGRGKL